MGSGCSSAGNEGVTPDRVDTAVVMAEEDAMKRRQSQHMAQNLVEEEFRRHVSDVYEITGGDVLGTGISGVVRTVKHKTTGEVFAMKTLHLKQIKDPEKLEELKNEVKIMAELDHPNIIRLYECYENDDHIYLIMELCTGGELLDRLNSQKQHHYNEKKAASIVTKMISAVRYLHLHNIVHRDLKLENFIFEDPSPDSEMKLIDFGLSRHYSQGEEMHMPVGTPFYVAPEVLRQAYTEECDMWSIGVIAYMLVSGRPPFMGNDERDTLALVKRGRYSFPPYIFDHISDNAKDFIRQLLVLDPAARMTAEQAQKHPWLHEWDHEPEPLKLEVVDNLKHFQELSAFQKLAHEVIAFTLQPAQIGDLRSEFHKFDVEGTGEISLAEMRQVLEQSAHMPNEVCDKIFESLNMDHSGKIHWIEFLAATMSRSVMDDAHLRAAFDRMDRDHDGFISEQDVHDLVGADMTESEIHGMFNGLHVENAGQISLDEFLSYMKSEWESPSKSFARRRVLDFSHLAETNILADTRVYKRMLSRKDSIKGGEGAAWSTEDIIGKLAMEETNNSSGPNGVPDHGADLKGPRRRSSAPDYSTLSNVGKGVQIVPASMGKPTTADSSSESSPKEPGPETAEASAP